MQLASAAWPTLNVPLTFSLRRFSAGWEQINGTPVVALAEQEEGVSTASLAPLRMPVAIWQALFCRAVRIWCQTERPQMQLQLSVNGLNLELSGVLENHVFPESSKILDSSSIHGQKASPHPSPDLETAPHLSASARL